MNLGVFRKNRAILKPSPASSQTDPYHSKNIKSEPDSPVLHVAQSTTQPKSSSCTGTTTFLIGVFWGRDVRPPMRALSTLSVFTSNVRNFYHLFSPVQPPDERNVGDKQPMIEILEVLGRFRVLVGPIFLNYTKI